MSTLGATVLIRDGNRLDFCWRECIESVLPVCDTVLVCDGESTDGTQEEVRDWMRREPRLDLCVYPWPEPHGVEDWFVTWINYARQHLRTDWHLQMDADEILHENGYETIRRFVSEDKERAAIFRRYNFWRDHRHLIPPGYCCGHEVIRLAPTRCWMASDGYHPLGEPVARMSGWTDPPLEIFHYGFIREREAFFVKERLLQGYFFGTYDKRLELAQEHAGNWMTMPGVTGWEDRVPEYTGEHPAAARAWLRERGYE